MSEFIKKNLILVVVLLATFATACVLIFLCISTHVDIKDSIEKINENNEVVKRKIDKCDPNAVQESVDLIMKDAEEMSEKASQIQQTFGKPFAKAFSHFTTVLNEMQITGPEVDAEKNASSETPSGKSSKKKDQQTVSVANPQLSFKESELKKRFAEVFKKFQADQKKKESKSKNRNNSGAGNLLELDAQKELFLAFRSDITAAPKNLKEADKSQTYKKNAEIKFDAAFAAFREDASHVTIEEMTDSTAYSLFMAALGLPRNMVPRECYSYINGMYERLDAVKSIPGAETFGGTKERAISFIYDSEGKPPAPDNVIAVFRRFQIMEDVFKRLNNAGIGMLSSVQFENSISGESLNGNQYLKYTITLDVESKLDSIRKMLNEFHNAYEEGHVYVITSVTLKRGDTGEVGGISFGVLEGSSGGMMGGMGGGRMPMMGGMRGGGGGSSSSRSTDPDAISGGGRMPMMGGMRGGSGGRMPMMGGSRAGGRMPMMGGARGRSADPDSMGGYGAQGNMDPSYDPDYGQASIGVSELVSGTITFDYLIYVGDEIKLNKR